MKKNNKYLLILSIILVICLIAYIGIRLASSYIAQRDEEQKANSTINLSNISDASEISFYNGTETLSFRYAAESDSWHLTDDASASIDDTVLKNIAKAVVGLTSENEITLGETAETAASYGFDDPLALRVEDTSGNVLDLTVGMSNGSLCYAMLAGNADVIYTIPAGISSYISTQLIDILQLETFPVLNESNITELTITMGGKPLRIYKEYTNEKNKEEYLWKYEIGGKSFVIDDKKLSNSTKTGLDWFSELTGSLASIKFDSIAEYKALTNPDNSYGIDNPQCTVEISYTESSGAESTCTLKLGNGIFDAEDEEATTPYMYYAVLDNSTTVNNIAQAYVTAIFDSYNAFTADTQNSVKTNIPVDSNLIGKLQPGEEQ